MSIFKKWPYNSWVKSPGDGREDAEGWAGVRRGVLLYGMNVCRGL